MDLLKKLRKLARDNLFNEKETTDFINLVESGTSIDDAIDIVEEGISENKPVKKTVNNEFNLGMIKEWVSLTRQLEALINEMDIDRTRRDEEFLRSDCGIVACWIVIRSLHDREYIDSFFQCLIRNLYKPKKVLHLDEENIFSNIYTDNFKKLDPPFEHWTKKPDSGHHLASAILDIITGNYSEEHGLYGATDCMKVFEFFTEKFTYMLEKQQSLRKKIKDVKNKPVQKSVTTEKPTEQPAKQADGVRAALDLLDEMAREFNNSAFEEIRKHLKRRFRKQRKQAAESFNDGKPPHKRIYTMVANLSGDWLECGEHHMYRGVLNPMGIGGALLKIFDTMQDKLVLIGACDKDFAQEQKKGVRENIKAVG